MDRSVLIQNTSKAQGQIGPSTSDSTESTGRPNNGSDVFEKWALGIEQPTPSSPGIEANTPLPGASPPNKPISARPDAPAPKQRSGPDDIWWYLRVQYGPLDWTAPLEAMKIITKNSSSNDTAFTPSSASSAPSDTLSSILTQVQINDLLLIFSEQYMPWLNFNLIREAESPLLDLICCTIAARHLDENTRSLVAHRLQTLTQDSSARLIFQSRRSESLEAIQCLLILSLWSPVSSEDFADGRLLIATAISMAMNIRLNEAPQRTLALLNSQLAGETVVEAHLLDSMDKTRLWISLSNAESLLCIGSGRGALSKRDPATYMNIFRLRETIPTDKIGGPDARLRILADLYEITERGFAIKFASHSEQDMKSWYRSSENVRKEFSQLERIIQPLGVLAEMDRFYFHILMVLLLSCRFLSVYNAMAVSRVYFMKHHRVEDGAYWYRTVRPHDDNVLIEYGKECLRLSEAILLNMMQTDVHRLGTCPDPIFLMISFAASYLVGVKFMLLRGMQRFLPGSSTIILSSCISHLRRAAYSTDHPANQCANAISTFVSLWENRETLMKQYQQEKLSLSSTQTQNHPSSSSDSGSFTNQSVPLAHPSAPMLMEPMAPSQMDFSWLNDPSFWNGILDTPL
ncbi:hypothetical protein V5O48_001485 [Marasmius crinis-equi]|uniref:Transcription factor domain-containing protein n=1 Tax=Marasmius crinis-equi TaxID=585013 RepID=A0ABR3FYX5_9AGAR